MKVKVDDYLGREREKHLTEFVASELVTDKEESGAIEGLECAQGNIVRLLAVLIDLLTERGILDGEDVKDLLSTYKIFEIIEE